MKKNRTKTKKKRKNDAKVLTKTERRKCEVKEGVFSHHVTLRNLPKLSNSRSLMEGEKVGTVCVLAKLPTFFIYLTILLKPRNLVLRI